MFNIQSYFTHFEADRLTFARELRGMTKKSLAELLDQSSIIVSQYETGKIKPSLSVFRQICQILDLPAAFFSARAQVPDMAQQCHFRANLRVSQNARQMARRYGSLVFAIFSYLEDMGINFPSLALPRYQQPQTENDLERLALDFRKDVNLGLGPIHNLASLVESLGVRIILLPPSDVKLDGFATWIAGLPCMMLDSDSCASRMQFNYAHELAHLIFDEDNSPSDMLLERRANRFAGALLMPAQTFKMECPRQYRQKQFQALKEHWHVSIAAALFRARQLGIMTEAAYRGATISRSRQGFRTVEEKEFELSCPTLLNQAMELVADEISLPELAMRIGIKVEEVIRILRTQQVNEFILARMLPPAKRARITQFSLIDKNNS